MKMFRVAGLARRGGRSSCQRWQGWPSEVAGLAVRGGRSSRQRWQVQPPEVAGLAPHSQRKTPALRHLHQVSPKPWFSDSTATFTGSSGPFANTRSRHAATMASTCAPFAAGIWYTLHQWFARRIRRARHRGNDMARKREEQAKGRASPSCRATRPRNRRPRRRARPCSSASGSREASCAPACRTA